MGFESIDLRQLEGEIQKGPQVQLPQATVDDPRKREPFNFLHVTLVSIRQVLCKHLNLDKNNVEYVFTDNVKQQWKLKNKVEYPRSQILFKSLSINRDRSNSKAALTGGYAAVQAAKKKNGNSIAVASVFPVTLNLSYHYFDNDQERLLRVLGTLATMAATGSGVYQVRIKDSHLHQSRLDFTDTIDVPQLDLSLDMNPESAELVAEFSVSTYLGTIYDVARNLNVQVDENIGAANMSINIVNNQGDLVE